jgi:hypothetical protein
MFALIFDKKVIQISKNIFEVNKEMIWVECDEEIYEGDSFENGKFLKKNQLCIDEKKQIKIKEIRNLRDQENLLPIRDHQAPVLDENGNLGENRFFLFHTTRHPSNPAADPVSILSNAIILESTNYFTRDLDGNKICVQINSEIARSLLAHLKNRNENNFKLAEAIISAINACETAEELENINWNTEFLQ